MSTSSRESSVREVRIWLPTDATDIRFPGLRIMHGGPRAMYLPEHEHAETQIQTCFHPNDNLLRLTPNCSSLYAPGQPHAGRWNDSWEVIVILVNSEFMSQAADELFARDRFQIKPFSKIRMPMIEHLTEAVLGEFHSPYRPSRLYIESIGHTIAGYLLRHHAVTNAKRAVRGMFSSAQLGRIERFIDERLGADFGINELAALMKLGPQRFSERFRLTTGLSPWQHVQLRRVKRAQHLLAHRKDSLAEIALSLGFSSQSHFTNVFRQAVGVTPRIYRNNNS